MLTSTVLSAGVKLVTPISMESVKPFMLAQLQLINLPLPKINQAPQLYLVDLVQLVLLTHLVALINLAALINLVALTHLVALILRLLRHRPLLLARQGMCESMATAS